MLTTGTGVGWRSRMRVAPWSRLGATKVVVDTVHGDGETKEKDLA